MPSDGALRTRCGKTPRCSHDTSFRRVRGVCVTMDVFDEGTPREGIGDRTPGDSCASIVTRETGDNAPDAYA